MSLENSVTSLVQDSIQGAGSPEYLDGASHVDTYVIGSVRYAFVASADDDALSIFNINDPTNISHVASITGAGSPNYLGGARWVKVYDISGTEYAFVVAEDDDALVVVDVSTPASPSKVGHIAGSGSPNYLSSPRSVDIGVVGGTEYAFVASYNNDTVVVFDVSTPATPSKTGHITGSGSPNYLNGASGLRFTTISGTEYVVVASDNDDALVIIDVSTPATPAIADTDTSATELNHAIDVTVMTISGTEYAFVATQYYLTIYDISTPSAIVKVASYWKEEAGLSGVNSKNIVSLSSVIDGTPCVFMAGKSGTLISPVPGGKFYAFDVTDPTDPKYAGGASGREFPNFMRQNVRAAAYTSGSDSYVVTVSDYENALTVFKLTTTSVTISHAGEIHGHASPNYLDRPYTVKLYVIDGTRYAFVPARDDDRLSIFSLATPSSPTHITSVTHYHMASPRFATVATIGGTPYAFVLGYTFDRLLIYDVSTPASPVLESVTEVGEDPRSVYVYDIGGTPYAFVLSADLDMLEAYDVSDVTSPSLEDSVSGSGSPNYLHGAARMAFQVIGGTEYLFIPCSGASSDRFAVWDVSDPTNLTLTTTLAGSGSPNYFNHTYDIKILTVGSDIHAYLVGDRVISIVDITTPASPVWKTSLGGAWGHPYCSAGATDLDMFEKGGKQYLVSGSIEDSIGIFDVTDVTAPPVFHCQLGCPGDGAPLYMDNIYGVEVFTHDGDLYVAAVAVSDNALVVASIQVAIFGGTCSVTSSVEADLELEGALRGTAAVTASLIADLTVPIDMEAFMAEVRKPHWYPVRRAYMLDENGTEHEITQWVETFDRILWQIEQEYHPNTFTANDCQISLKNRETDFDIDQSDNFFVRVLNRQQDGYKVPVVIKCGYRMLDGTEQLLTVFYGLIVDIDTTVNNDIAVLSLQCVSRTLRDASIEDFGEQWTNTRIYGGNSFCYTDGVIEADDWDSDELPRIPVKNTKSGDPTGNFPDGFPPFGFVQLNDEIFYYSYLGTDSLEGCVRARHGTTQAVQANETRVDVLLLDGSDTDSRYFQFMAYPVSRGSLEHVSSSDGEINIVDEGTVLGIPEEEKKLTGFVDHENGVLELLAAPTDPATLTSTYKSAFHNIAYHSLVERLLEEQVFSTDFVEEAVLRDYLGRTVPINLGRITSAYQGTSLTVIPGTKAYALCLDDSDDLYIGVGQYIIKWDGEVYTLLADLGSDNHIYRMGVDSSGNVYGISGKTDSQTYRNVFKFNGSTVSFLVSGDLVTGADYMNVGVETDEEGGQWRNFTVDNDNSCVWYLYKGSGSRGIAKVSFSGGSPTQYSRSVTGDRRSDFVDCGTTIEFFYNKDIGGGDYEIRYETLTKSTGNWVDHGWIKNAPSELTVSDCIYNSGDGKIYMNITRISAAWHCWFCSIDKDFITETDIEEHEFSSGTNRYKTWHSRYCGGVEHDGYVWFIRGTGVGLGGESDDATGHLYKVKNNEIEDRGGLALRPQTREGHYLREEVTGHTAVMVYRASDEAIYYISSDQVVRYDHEYGYSLGHLGESFSPIVRVADLNERKVWDVLSELAVLANFELGISKEGKVFWRERLSTISLLGADVDSSTTTITTDGTNMDDFDDSGTIQIGTEVIEYTGKTSTQFTGCSRGVWNSTAASHNEGDTVWEIHGVLANFDPPYGSHLKLVEKKPNWDEIFNYIEVPYGDETVIFDYAMNKESWVGSSEQIYGRKTLTISNTFLSEDDVYFAESIGFRYYDFWHNRHSLLVLETKWQPQLDLGQTLSIKQVGRVILNFSIARMRRIEMELSGFYIRIMAIVAPGRYRDDVYEYE